MLYWRCNAPQEERDVQNGRETQRRDCDGSYAFVGSKIKRQKEARYDVWFLTGMRNYQDDRSDE